MLIKIEEGKHVAADSVEQVNIQHDFSPPTDTAQVKIMLKAGRFISAGPVSTKEQAQSLADEIAERVNQALVRSGAGTFIQPMVYEPEEMLMEQKPCPCVWRQNAADAMWYVGCLGYDTEDDPTNWGTCPYCTRTLKTISHWESIGG